MENILGKIRIKVEKNEDENSYILQILVSKTNLVFILIYRKYPEI